MEGRVGKEGVGQLAEKYRYMLWKERQAGTVVAPPQPRRFGGLSTLFFYKTQQRVCKPPQVLAGSELIFRTSWVGLITRTTPSDHL